MNISRVKIKMRSRYWFIAQWKIVSSTNLCWNFSTKCLVEWWCFFLRIFLWFSNADGYRLLYSPERIALSICIAISIYIAMDNSARCAAFKLYFCEVLDLRNRFGCEVKVKYLLREKNFVHEFTSALKWRSTAATEVILFFRAHVQTKCQTIYRWFGGKFLIYTELGHAIRTLRVRSSFTRHLEVAFEFLV